PILFLVPGASYLVKRRSRPLKIIFLKTPAIDAGSRLGSPLALLLKSLLTPSPVIPVVLLASSHGVRPLFGLVGSLVLLPSNRSCSFPPRHELEVATPPEPPFRRHTRSGNTSLLSSSERGLDISDTPARLVASRIGAGPPSSSDSGPLRCSSRSPVVSQL